MSKHDQGWNIYTAEWMCDWNWHSNEMTNHEIENFVNGLLLPAGFDFPVYKFKDKETKYASAELRGKKAILVIPPRAKNKRYLAHELAHILGAQNHEKKFAAAELQIVERVFGLEKCKELEAAFRVKGVKWLPNWQVKWIA